MYNTHKLNHSPNSATCLAQVKQNRHKDVNLCTTFDTKYTNSYLLRNPDNFINVQRTTSYIHSLLHNMLRHCHTGKYLNRYMRLTISTLLYVVEGTCIWLIRHICSTRNHRKRKESKCSMGSSPEHKHINATCSVKNAGYDNIIADYDNTITTMTRMTILYAE